MWLCECVYVGTWECVSILNVCLCVWHTWMCECVCGTFESVGMGMYECMCEHMWVCLCVHKWWCGGYMWVYECTCGTCECVNRCACVNVRMLELESGQQCHSPCDLFSILKLWVWPNGSRCSESSLLMRRLVHQFHPSSYSGIELKDQTALTMNCHCPVSPDSSLVPLRLNSLALSQMAGSLLCCHTLLLCYIFALSVSPFLCSPNNS